MRLFAESPTTEYLSGWRAIMSKVLTPMEPVEPRMMTPLAAEVTPVGQIGDYNFEVGALTREISQGYEKLVRS